MTVVVVLPWVPEMATARAPAISSASATLRGTIGKTQLPCPLELGMAGGDRGRDHEGPDSGQMSRVVPCAIRTPSAARSAAPVGSVSQPLTATPRRQAMSASALIPAPPIPMK